MQLGRHLPRTRLTELARLSVNSIRLMYKKFRKPANVKLHIIFNIPNFTSQFIPPKILFLFKGKKFFPLP
jgi:hypothetical protein